MNKLIEVAILCGKMAMMRTMFLYTGFIYSGLEIYMGKSNYYTIVFFLGMMMLAWVSGGISLFLRNQLETALDEKSDVEK